MRKNWSGDVVEELLKRGCLFGVNVDFQQLQDALL